MDSRLPQQLATIRTDEALRAAAPPPARAPADAAAPWRTPHASRIGSARA